MLHFFTRLEHYQCQSETKVASAYIARFHVNCEEFWNGIGLDFETDDWNLYWFILGARFLEQRS